MITSHPHLIKPYITLSLLDIRHVNGTQPSDGYIVDAGSNKAKQMNCLFNKVQCQSHTDRCNNNNKNIVAQQICWK